MVHRLQRPGGFDPEEEYLNSPRRWNRGRNPRSASETSLARYQLSRPHSHGNLGAASRLRLRRWAAARRALLAPVRPHGESRGKCSYPHGISILAKTALIIMLMFLAERSGKR